MKKKDILTVLKSRTNNLKKLDLQSEELKDIELYAKKFTVKEVALFMKKLKEAKIDIPEEEEEENDEEKEVKINEDDLVKNIEFIIEILIENIRDSEGDLIFKENEEILSSLSMNTINELFSQVIEAAGMKHKKEDLSKN